LIRRITSVLLRSSLWNQVCEPFEYRNAPRYSFAPIQTALNPLLRCGVRHLDCRTTPEEKALFLSSSLVLFRRRRTRFCRQSFCRSVCPFFVERTVRRRFEGRKERQGPCPFEMQ